MRNVKKMHITCPVIEMVKITAKQPIVIGGYKNRTNTTADTSQGKNKTSDISDTTQGFNETEAEVFQESDDERGMFKIQSVVGSISAEDLNEEACDDPKPASQNEMETVESSKRNNESDKMEEPSKTKLTTCISHQKSTQNLTLW